MPIKTVTECCFCGKIKETANHWHKIVSDASGFKVYPLQVNVGQAVEIRIACSDSHITSALSEWLTQQKQKGMDV